VREKGLLNGQGKSHFLKVFGGMKDWEAGLSVGRVLTAWGRQVQKGTKLRSPRRNSGAYYFIGDNNLGGVTAKKTTQAIKGRGEVKRGRGGLLLSRVGLSPAKLPLCFDAVSRKDGGGKDREEKSQYIIMGRL